MTEDYIIKFNALKESINKSKTEVERKDLVFQKNKIYDLFKNKNISFFYNNGGLTNSFAELIKNLKFTDRFNELAILNEIHRLRYEADKKKAVINVDLVGKAEGKDFLLLEFKSPYSEISDS